MASINTLVSDIQKLVTRTDGWLDEALASSLSTDIATRLREQYGRKEQAPTLRLSQMGARCPRQLWNSIHHPELAEALPAWAQIKFSFGHILEAFILPLAKAAGHDVTGEQSPVYVDGIKGHRDAVIDGCVVDVKSAASRSFQKFKDGSLGNNDGFGYLDQLDAYLVGSSDDPLVTVKDKGYLLAIDKQLGHMCLYEHHIRERSIHDRIAEYKEVVAKPAAPPCTCKTEPDGKSGNVGLDYKASYNPFKWECFPGLRCFLYSDGPRFLSKVVKRPKRADGTLIPEIDKHGKYVYH